MPRLAITGVGLDRPGIVAGVTRALFEHGCNLEDSAMSVLERWFALLIVVEAPDATSAGSLRDAIRGTGERLGVHLDVCAIHDGAPGDGQERATHGLVTVAGRDQAGITCRITEVLAAHGVNVTGLESRRMAGEDGPVYLLTVAVAWPAGTDEAALDADLGAAAQALGLDLRRRAVDSGVF